MLRGSASASSPYQGVAHCEMVLNPSVLAKLARSTVNCAPKNSVPTAVPSRKVPAMPLTIRKALNVYSPRKFDGVRRYSYETA